MDRVEPNSRFHTIGVYTGDLTVPGSSEYQYLPSKSVFELLPVPRVEVLPATRIMTNEGPPLRSVPMDPVESRGSAVNPFRSHIGTGARELQATSETVRLASVDPWKDSRVTSRYEPDSYASDRYAAPTLRLPLLQSRLREMGLWVGVVGIYGDGHILDEKTILAALTALTAERDQARERAEFAEGTARDMTKQERERKDDLEMEVRRFRMAIVAELTACVVRAHHDRIASLREIARRHEYKYRTGTRYDNLTWAIFPLGFSPSRALHGKSIFGGRWVGL
jgi:hypothetical protein